MGLLWDVEFEVTTDKDEEDLANWVAERFYYDNPLVGLSCGKQFIDLTIEGDDLWRALRETIKSLKEGEVLITKITIPVLNIETKDIEQHERYPF